MMSQENQLPGTGTLEARVTEYHIRKVIRKIFRTTSFFRGGHGADFDVRRRFVEERSNGSMGGRRASRGPHRSTNRANLKCRGIFATAPQTFTCFRNLTESKGGGSAPHRMHLPALARTFCLINLAIQWLANNYPPASSRSPKSHPRNFPR